MKDNKTYQYHYQFDNLAILYEFFRNIKVNADTFKVVDYDYIKPMIQLEKFDTGPHKVPTNITLKLTWNQKENEIELKETNEIKDMEPNDYLDEIETTTKNIQKFSIYKIQNSGLTIYQSQINQTIRETETSTSEDVIVNYENIFSILKLGNPLSISRYPIPEDYVITDGIKDLNKEDSYIIQKKRKK